MLSCKYGRITYSNSSFINCHTISMVTSVEGRGSLESCYQPRQAVVYFATYNKYSRHTRNFLYILNIKEQARKIV